MSSKQKQPVRKGVAKVPVVMQMEALECGAASLCMILAYYGKWVPLEQVRKDCGVSRNGSKAGNMITAAENYGMTVEAFRYEPEALRRHGTFPCIIHWNFNHFVVCDGFRGNKAYLNDPAKGNIAVPMDVFDESFTGITLQMVPGESFEPSGKPKSMTGFVIKRLKSARAALIFVTLSSAIAALLGIPAAGQRQRLMIARAIAPKPKVLFFDEATSALDNVTQKKISDAMGSMKCTRVVIAHRLSTIRQCDRILVLENGKIIEDGNYDELMARNGFFAELVARQQVEEPDEPKEA